MAKKQRNSNSVASKSKSATQASSSAVFWRSVSLALTILILSQWILFVMVLDNGGYHHDSSTSTTTSSVTSPLLFAATTTIIKDSKKAEVEESLSSKSRTGFDANNNSSSREFEGIAATVMLRAPKWFHRRYTTMIHNVMANIPSSWGIQILYNAAWLKKDVLPLHPGLHEMFFNKNRIDQKQSSRIVWTPIPQDMTRKKPKEIMKSIWLWESMLNENVLLFSGNGALCANSHFNINNFLHLDYVGAPWKQHGGIGGDGSTHSFRHKSAMIRILKQSPPQTDSPDHQYFVKEMINSNKQNNNNDSNNKSYYKLADQNTTIAFAGVVVSDNNEDNSNNIKKTPFLLSGTQAKLNWTIRENLLGVCPELKMIFPSMHEPSCFGAHPNPKKCQSTICALQDPLPGHGC